MRLWLVLACCSLYAQETGTVVASWSATSSLAEPRHHACAARLAGGSILIAGGTGVAGDLNTTEIYLAEGTFIPGPRMKSARSGHTCTTLQDGRVLVAGGDAERTGSAEVFDAEAKTWQVIPGSGEPRSEHTATLLADGRVLISGGNPAALEIFDPEANSLTRSGATLAEPRDQHAAAVLADGRVLIIGGRGADGPLASSEVFDPAAGTVTAGPVLATARAGHSATPIPGGRVLVAGGFDGQKETDTAELFNPETGVWEPLEARLNTARRDHIAVVIPGNGGVLIAGGLRQDEALAATELFKPSDNTFLTLGALTAPRTGLAAAPVGDGVILAAGGLNAGGVQSACGVLATPALVLSKSLYNPGDTVQVSGKNFPPGKAVTLLLSIVRPGSVGGRRISVDIRTRGSAIDTAVDFDPVTLSTALAGDEGAEAHVQAIVSGADPLVVTPIKLHTTLTLTVPVVFEGSPVTLEAVLTRPSSAVPMTGFLSITGSRGIAGVDVAVNTTGTRALAQLSLTPVPLSARIIARYQGDAANEPAVEESILNTIRKTPRVSISASTTSPQVGSPLTLTVRVSLDAAPTTPRNIGGTITILESGFPIATLPVRMDSASQASASTDFTPLTLNTLRLTAQYSGDDFFSAAASQTVNLTVDKAAADIRIVNPPATYHCGQSVTFNVALTFPSALGLSNRTFTLTFVSAIGKILGTPLIGTLTPDSANLGTAAGSVTAAIPLDTVAVDVSFSGDSLLGAEKRGSPLALQLSPVSVAFVGLAGTVTGSANLVARVTSGSCTAGPTGTVEFLDGSASLGVRPVAATFSVSQSAPGAFADSSALTVARPAGLHNLQVRYSGDSHYSPAASIVVPVVFQ